MRTQSKIFCWQGIDAHGVKISGECPATNTTHVKELLKKQHILTLSIKAKRRHPTFIFTAKIKSADITQFNREMATLINSGIPLAKALSIINQSIHNKRLQALIISLQKNIENGILLSEAMQQKSQHFDSLTRSLIHVGEQTGTLDLVLLHIAEHSEKMFHLKKKIIKALYYPLVVLCVATAITIALLLFVIPQFSQLFASVGAPLPAFTQLVITTAQQLRLQGVNWFISLCTILLFCKICLIRFKKLQILFAQFILKIPLFGVIYQRVIFVRSFKTLSMTLHAGQPLLSALQLTADTSGNHIYEKTWRHVANKISAGCSLQEALQHCKQFPQRIVQLVAIGEESGQLEQMLVKLTDHYSAEVDHSIEVLNQLLEPTIMIFLAVVIGALVTSVYLPIFRLGTVI